VLDAAGNQVSDVIIIGRFLRGVSDQIFFFSFFGFSIVPKPPMQWIRQPWLPFGVDLPIKDQLFGILPIVFVVRLG